MKTFPSKQTMKIKATFLDEISHDIPHQNWSEKEWDADFALMKAVGIEMVVMIRCGYKRFITYPSHTLTQDEKCLVPPVDLVDMFLRLSDKYSMQFYFGLYDSGRYWVDADFWTNGNYEREVAINKAVIDEVWTKYGRYKSFSGWYLSQEWPQWVNNGICDLLAVQCYRRDSMAYANTVKAAQANIRLPEGKKMNFVPGVLLMVSGQISEAEQVKKQLLANRKLNTNGEILFYNEGLRLPEIRKIIKDVYTEKVSYPSN